MVFLHRWGSGSLTGETSTQRTVCIRGGPGPSSTLRYIYTYSLHVRPVTAIRPGPNSDHQRYMRFVGVTLQWFRPTRMAPARDYSGGAENLVRWLVSSETLYPNNIRSLVSSARAAMRSRLFWGGVKSWFSTLFFQSLFFSFWLRTLLLLLSVCSDQAARRDKDYYLHTRHSYHQYH